MFDAPIPRDPVAHMAAGAGDVPVHYFSPAALDRRLASFGSGFPGLVTYAVKANPDEQVIARLCAGGMTAFDVASPEEIALVRRLCPGAALHYNNPVRSRGEIAAGLAAGVASWSVDCAGELDKLTDLLPQGAEIAVRFKLPVAGAAYDFGAKFGAEPEEAAELLAVVAARGYGPALTFHVGTQNTDPGAWETYLTAAADIARRAGVRPGRVNVGGGFPAARDGGAPDLAPFFAAIRRGAAAFDTSPALVCEPGRGLVADAFAYGVEVKSVRGSAIYLADGIYGGLSEFVSFALPRIRVVAPGGALRTAPPRPRTVWGPTCDSLDRIPGEVTLPGDLAEGDWLLFDGMGAYLNGVTTTFNGYGARRTVEVDRL
ncbi:hypothetical protein [Wenxinia marina]|uniref:ornithine decarboxylase n=1 Tax=Wenxinia marina DSM 24838 TaxID=1123501 RepID=A0A0D0QBW9_9RHOB|nr:hypothetical protein [Wenxinia marina]KIQ68453.1 Diaminopimelate decarboxylase [Wenxinia marina DSM 24838]GGL72119.1 ornithine decarboxylase [Wenxinia marina]